MVPHIRFPALIFRHNLILPIINALIIMHTHFNITEPDILMLRMYPITCRGVSAVEGSNKGDSPQEKLVGL